MSKEQLEAFLELAQSNFSIQERISRTSNVDEVELIAKQAGFSISTSDLEDWHSNDEYSDGFEEDLYIVIEMYNLRGVGKECDPEWKQLAKRRERRRDLGLD